MVKYTILAPTKRFVNAESSDLTIPIELKSEQKVLNQTDRSVVLNLSEQFYNERQRSNKYRLTGALKPIWSNTAEVSTNNRNILSEMFLNSDGIENIINNSVDRNTIEGFTFSELSGWISSDELDFIRKDYDGSNDPNIYKPFSITQAHRQNWELCLTYSKNKNTDKTFKVLDVYMKKILNVTTPIEFNIADGLPYIIREVDYYYEFYCPFGHNLNGDNDVKIGDEILIVDSIGNGNEGFKNKVFYINKNVFQTQPPQTGTFKRVVNEVVSEYYQTKNEVIRTFDDIDIQRNGFYSSIFEDEKKLPKYYIDQINGSTIDLDYNGDGKVVTKENGDTYMWLLENYIDTSELYNHLDNPVTEIQLSVIFKNNMEFFEQQKTSFEPNTGDNQEDNTFDVASDLGGVVTKDFDYGDLIDGDIFEYNQEELTEYLIQSRVNRITYNPARFEKPKNFIFNEEGVIEREEEKEINGYYYKVNHPIKLQVYSPYIETANSDEIYNLPKNAKFDEKTQKWRWRDIYDKGFIDNEGVGVDYPYRNGTHYIHNEIFFYIKPDTIDGLTNIINEIPEKFLTDEC